ADEADDERALVEAAGLAQAPGCRTRRIAEPLWVGAVAHHDGALGPRAALDQAGAQHLADREHHRRPAEHLALGLPRRARKAQEAELRHLVAHRRVHLEE